MLVTVVVFSSWVLGVGLHARRRARVEWKREALRQLHSR